MPTDNLYPGTWLPCESCEGQVDYLQLLFWCFPLAADDAAPQHSAKAECRYSIANRSAVLSSRFKFGKLIIREAISGIYNVSTTNASNLCWDSLNCGLLYNYFKCILMAPTPKGSGWFSDLFMEWRMYRSVLISNADYGSMIWCLLFVCNTTWRKVVPSVMTCCRS